jgi:hypothetical protein
MDYTTKFALRDKVWCVSDQEFYHIVKCKPCGNTGKVLIAGEELICPKCNGKSTHRQYAGRKFYISEFGTTVGQVRVEHTDLSSVSYYDNGEPNPKIEYMLTATGVCSGQIWKEDRLFASEEEARAHCDRKNGVLPPDETKDGKDVLGMYGEVLRS